MWREGRTQRGNDNMSNNEEEVIDYRGGNEKMKYVEKREET